MNCTIKYLKPQKVINVGDLCVKHKKQCNKVFFKCIVTLKNES